MAKYNIAYSCGHTEEKQLYGKESVRQSYIDWAGRAGVCAACRAADAEAACEAVEVEHDLPALRGSEKQIAWARKIRAEAMTAIANAFAAARAKAEAAGMLERYETEAGALMQAVSSQTTAAYWIDHRADTAAQHLMAAKARLAQ